VGLCKHTWTKGIDTSLGDPGGHDFPGIIVGSLKPDDSRPGGGPGRIGIVNDEGEGGMVVQGEYEVEEDMFTARGCGLRLSVSPGLWSGGAVVSRGAVVSIGRRGLMISGRYKRR